MSNDVFESAEYRSSRGAYCMECAFEYFVKNKGFRSIVLLSVLWYAAAYTTIGFLGIYKISELAYTVGAMQLVNTIGCLLQFGFSKPLGRYSDKHSYAHGLVLAMFIAAASFLVNIFTTPELRWLIIVHVLLYHISAAGIGQNLLLVTYSYVDNEYITEAMAIKESIAGVIGFLVSLAAGKLLSAIQGAGNTLFGIHIYAQQVLSLISFLLTVIIILFTKIVIEKQKPMIQ